MKSKLITLAVFLHFTFSACADVTTGVSSKTAETQTVTRDPIKLENPLTVAYLKKKYKEKQSQAYSYTRH